MHWSSLNDNQNCYHINTETHTRLTALFPGLPRWAGTRKVKPIWILLKQETVIGNGISWAICKSAPRSRQITMPPHHSVFYRPDALSGAKLTGSKHWRHKHRNYMGNAYNIVCVRCQTAASSKTRSQPASGLSQSTFATWLNCFTAWYTVMLYGRT